MNLLCSYLSQKHISLDIAIAHKNKVIQHLIQHLVKVNNELDESEILQAVLQREKEVSTFIGFHCAIPHAHIPTLSKTYIVAGRTAEMVSFGESGEHVKLLFIIVGPMRQSSLHLRLLSSVARVLHREEIRLSLLQAKDTTSFYSILCHEGEKE